MSDIDMYICFGTRKHYFAALQTQKSFTIPLTTFLCYLVLNLVQATVHSLYLEFQFCNFVGFRTVVSLNCEPPFKNIFDKMQPRC